MQERKKKYGPALLSFALACLSLASCATTRGTLDVPLRVSSNPQEGQAVKLVRVTDQRPFELKPRDASIPSLKGGEIDDPAITSRAIARKRNTFGKAIGDILLPEGRTVEELATSALVRGLRESGLRVLEAGAEGYDGATSLEADIDQFWMWFTPGFWAAHIEFEARITITGSIEPFTQGEEFRGYIRLSTQAARGSTEVDAGHGPLAHQGQASKVHTGHPSVPDQGQTACVEAPDRTPGNQGAGGAIGQAGSHDERVSPYDFLSNKFPS